jgi:phosphomevalonate kinase
MAAAADVDYDLPIFGALATLAAAFGGAAKPSGAGGGDVAVALLPDPEARAHFERACDDAGFHRIPVEIAGPASCT